MKIIEKFKAKSESLYGAPPVTIAFLGDSVTQGCFDLYHKTPTSLETYFDAEGAYHTSLRKIFNLLYPNVPLNIINAGISGSNATNGLSRIERDVLRYSPDLCVVCFGLNDCLSSEEGAIDKYKSSLEGIFKRLQEAQIEAIFMTPNMMCTEVMCDLKSELIKKTASEVAKAQLDGKLDLYMEAAKQTAARMNVPVCDCYAKWKTLHENGVKVTNLLANKVNHPTKEMNWLFAVSLAETMFKS